MFLMDCHTLLNNLWLKRIFFETVLKPKWSRMIILVIIRCFFTARTILITMGASNRFLEDLSLDIPRD